MRKTTSIALVLLASAIASGASAQQIYKWTDADGNVHYEDKPIAADSERVAITTRPTDPARVQARTEARLQSGAMRAEQEEAAAEAAAAAAEQQAEAEQRQEKCEQYRATLQKFLVSRRLYREDDEGEREYLDESETQAARDRVEGQVEEFCS